MSCQSAVVLTLVQGKHIRININKRINTKNTGKTIKNTVNKITHITKPPPHIHTQPHITIPTHTHTHTLKKQVKITTVQVKTNTVQDILK